MPLLSRRHFFLDIFALGELVKFHSFISALAYLLSAKHIIPAVLFPSGSKLGSARIKPTVFCVTTVFPNHLFPALLPAGLLSRHAGLQTYCYSWAQEADKAREWQPTSNQVTGTPWMLPSHIWMVAVLSWMPPPFPDHTADTAATAKFPLADLSSSSPLCLRQARQAFSDGPRIDA